MGAWGKTCAQPLVVSLGRAFPLGPTAGRIGKSGRPHILCFCVLKFVTRYRGVLVMFLCQACRCGRLGASATLSLHPVLIVFLCFEIRIPRYRVVVVMFFSQACRCGRLGASATLSFHPVLIVFLCFEIRSPLSSRCGHVFHPVLIVFLCFEIRNLLSSRCGHVFQPSLSLWTAWRVCYFEFPSCSYCVSVF